VSTAPLTYQQRDAASKLPFMPPLKPGDLVYTPGKPQFSQLAADTLGNAGTTGDGFDALFASVATIVDADIISMGVLDGFLAAAGFVDGAIASAVYTPIAHQYDTFLAVGDADIGSIDDVIGGSSPPAGPGGGCP
jgi:hypothetical protein